MKRLEKPAVYIPLAALCCLLWSSAFPAIKSGYALFAIAAEDYAAQILFAGCRFFLAGVLTILFASIIAKKALIPKRARTWRDIGILALVQTVLTYTFFYISLAKIEGSAGSVINCAGTFFCVLLAAAVYKKSDALTLPTVLGCLIGFVGIVLLNLKSFRLGFHAAGEGLMLLSALCYAVSSVCIKQFSKRENPALLSGWQFLLGGLVMIAAGLAMGGRLQKPSAGAVLLLLYLALVSAVAYTLWGVLLKHNAVSKIAIFGFINPVGGVILSALLLHEQTDVLLCTASLALVSIGIVLVHVKKS